MLSRLVIMAWWANIACINVDPHRSYETLASLVVLYCVAVPVGLFR